VNSKNDAPQNGVPPHSPNGKKDRSGWWQVGVAIMAVVVAGIAAGFSLYQANQASQQNEVSEQQALVTLVSAIAQDPQTIQQETEAFKGNQAAVDNAVSGTDFTELTDSEEASYLIGLLKGNGVTAIEYYETGLGLEASQSDTRTINLLDSAIAEATSDKDPRTLANAWYALASISYQDGETSSYSKDLTNAKNAFSSSLGATSFEYDRNLAYLRLFDGSYKAAAHDCVTARTELNEASTILANIHSSPGPGDSAIMAQILKNCPHA
jgi:hypothetical protein